jgi:hypothetical protein
VSSALDRLKAKLDETRFFYVPADPPLTELTEPSPDEHQESGLQSAVGSVSSVSGGLADMQKNHHADPEGRAPHNRGLSPRRWREDGDSTEVPLPPTDRTDRTPRSMNARLRVAEWAQGYLAEVTPADGTQAAPCGTCGDRVFYRLAKRSPWRCRTCEPERAVHRGAVVRDARIHP